MGSKDGYEFYRKDQREALASYEGATFPMLRDIATALADSEISLPMLLRAIAEPRGFRDAAHALLKRRPYQDFNSFVFDSDGVRRLLRTTMRFETCRESGPVDRTLLDHYGEKRYIAFDDRVRVEDAIRGHLGEIERACGRGFGDPLLGLEGYRSPQVSPGTLLPHWLVPIAVPMFETVDKTFEFLCDAAVMGKEHWRDYAATGAPGLLNVEHFTPNRIAIMRFGLYEPQRNDSFADVQRWMEEHGARFASYECFAALIQYPDILRWIEQDPRGGMRAEPGCIVLPTMRTYYESLESDEYASVYCERATRYVGPVVRGFMRGNLYDPMDRHYFPYVLSPDAILDPNELLIRR